MIPLQKKFKKPYVYCINIKKEFDKYPQLDYLENSTDPRDKERLKDYYNNYWHMFGIYAETTILIPYPKSGYTQQVGPIRTGGLWSIESDSDPEYIKEVISDELEQLKDILKKLHVTIPKQYTLIEEEIT